MKTPSEKRLHRKNVLITSIFVALVVMVAMLIIKDNANQKHKQVLPSVEDGKTNENGRWYIKDVVMDYKHTYDLGDRCQQLIDYLRSIGVLVGFRQFTPEMLIAEGVVKIKV